MFSRHYSVSHADVAGPSLWHYWTRRGAAREVSRRNARLVAAGLAPRWAVTR